MQNTEDAGNIQYIIVEGKLCKSQKQNLHLGSPKSSLDTILLGSISHHKMDFVDNLSNFDICERWFIILKPTFLKI